jgi:hypothetical protein
MAARAGGGHRRQHAGERGRESNRRERGAAKESATARAARDSVVLTVLRNHRSRFPRPDERALSLGLEGVKSPFLATGSGVPP